jgi:transposase
VLKEALGVVWTCRHRGYARRYLEKWLDWAMESGLEPVKRFARTLKKHIPEVLNYCKHQITTGPLEGFNNTVSLLIHRANGFKNMEYRYLKLRQESLA